MARKGAALPPRRRARAAIAIVLAPLCAAFAVSLVLFSIEATPGAQMSAQIMFMIFAIFSVYGLLAMLLVGWPFHAVAFRRRWRSAPTYVFAGGGAGFVSACLAFLLYLRQTPGVTTLSLLGAAFGIALLIVLPGLLAGWLFWLIRRPDRDRDGDPASVFE